MELVFGRLIELAGFYRHTALHPPEWYASFYDFGESLYWLTNTKFHSEFPCETAYLSVLFALHARYSQIYGDRFIDLEEEYFPPHGVVYLSDDDRDLPDPFKNYLKQWWRDVRCKLAFNVNRLE